MENNYDYKDEIISSRVGNLGGSDARILAAIAKNGCVQKGQSRGVLPLPKVCMKDQTLLILPCSTVIS